MNNNKQKKSIPTAIALVVIATLACWSLLLQARYEMADYERKLLGIRFAKTTYVDGMKVDNPYGLDLHEYNYKCFGIDELYLLTK